MLNFSQLHHQIPVHSWAEKKTTGLCWQCERPL
jgi:hypothetical protein